MEIENSSKFKSTFFKTLTSDSFSSKFSEFRTKEETSFLKTKFKSRAYNFKLISDDIFLLGFCLGIESYYRENRSLKNIDSFFGKFLKDIGPEYLDFKYADQICNKFLGSTFNYVFIKQIEDELLIFEDCDLEGFYERFGESMRFNCRNLMSGLMRICSVSIIFNITVSKESQILTTNTVNELIKSSKFIYNCIGFEERIVHENFLNLIMNVICEFFSISIKQYNIRNNEVDFSQTFPENSTPSGPLSSFKVAFVSSYNIHEYYLISKTESAINPQPLNCYDCKNEIISTENATPLKYPELSPSQGTFYVNPFICKLCAINNYCSLDMNKLEAPYFESFTCHHKFCLSCLQARLPRILEANLAENEKIQFQLSQKPNTQANNPNSISDQTLPDAGAIDLSQKQDKMKCFVKNCELCLSLTELNIFLEKNKINNPKKICEMCGVCTLNEITIQNKKKGAKFFKCCSCNIVFCATHKKNAVKCYCLCEHCGLALKDAFIMEEMNGEIYQYFECEKCQIITCSECKQKVKRFLGPCKCKCITCANKILNRSETKMKKCWDCFNVCDGCFLILDGEKVNYCGNCERNTCRTCINVILREEKEEKGKLRRCGYCYWKEKGRKKPFYEKLVDFF